MLELENRVPSPRDYVQYTSPTPDTMATEDAPRWSFANFAEAFDNEATNDSATLYNNIRAHPTIYQRDITETEKLKDQYLAKRDTCVTTLVKDDSTIVRLRQERNNLMKEQEKERPTTPPVWDTPPVPPVTLPPPALYQRSEKHLDPTLFASTSAALLGFLVKLWAKL